MHFASYILRMTFEWTAHRFSGGALAFDLVNTIVCRNQPDKRIDRLSGSEAVATFAKAAARFRSGEIADVAISASETLSANQNLLGLREAIDGYFRPVIIGGVPEKGCLSALFAAAAIATDGDEHPGNLGALASVSAMRLLDGALLRRAKICPNCDWLFLDRSKNQSRLWCDMAVCGNRNKAKLHYSKQRATGKEGAHV